MGDPVAWLRGQVERIERVPSDDLALRALEQVEGVLPSFAGAVAEAINPPRFRGQGLGSVAWARMAYCLRSPCLADARDERPLLAEAAALLDGCLDVDGVSHDRRFVHILMARAHLRRGEVADTYRALRRLRLAEDPARPITGRRLASADLLHEAVEMRGAATATRDLRELSATSTIGRELLDGLESWLRRVATRPADSLDPILVAHEVFAGASSHAADAVVAWQRARARRPLTGDEATRLTALFDAAIGEAAARGDAHKISWWGAHAVDVFVQIRPPTDVMAWVVQHIAALDAGPYVRACLISAAARFALRFDAEVEVSTLIELRDRLHRCLEDWPSKQNIDDFTACLRYQTRLERRIAERETGNAQAPWGRTPAERLGHLQHRRLVDGELLRTSDPGRWVEERRAAWAPRLAAGETEAVHLEQVAAAAVLSMTRERPHLILALDLLRPLLADEQAVDPMVRQLARIDACYAALHLSKLGDDAPDLQRRALEDCIAFAAAGVAASFDGLSREIRPRMFANLASGRSALATLIGAPFEPELIELARRAFELGEEAGDAWSASVGLLTWGRLLDRHAGAVDDAAIDAWLQARDASAMGVDLDDVAPIEQTLRLRRARVTVETGAIPVVDPLLPIAAELTALIAIQGGASSDGHARRLARVVEVATASIGDDDPETAWDARTLRCTAWIQLIHHLDSLAAMRAARDDLRTWDPPARPAPGGAADARWRRLMMVAGHAYAAALTHDRANVTTSDRDRCDRILARVVETASPADEDGVLSSALSDRALLRLGAGFPGGVGAASMEAVEMFQAALQLCGDREPRPERRELWAMCTIGLAIALGRSPTTGGEHLAEILDVALSLSNRVADDEQVTPMVRARALFTSGNLAHRMFSGSQPPDPWLIQAALASLQRAEALTRGRGDQLRHDILRNLAIVGRDAGLPPEHLTAWADERDQSSRAWPDVEDNAEQRIHVLMEREQWADAYRQARVAADEVEGERRRDLLELALHSGLRWAAQHDRDAGVTDGASGFHIVRDTVAVELVADGRAASAAALLRISAPEPWPEMLSWRSLVSDPDPGRQARHHELMARLAIEDAADLATAHEARTGAYHRAIDRAVHSRCPLTVPEPVWRMALGPRGTALVGEQAPAQSALIERATTTWWLDRTLQPEPAVEQAFQALNGYLAGVRLLARVRRLLRDGRLTSPDQVDDAARRVERSAAAAAAALATLTRGRASPGYFEGQRLHAMLVQYLPDAMEAAGAPLPGQLVGEALDAAVLSVDGAWSSTVARLVDELRDLFGAWIARQPAPLTLVPSANYHLLPLELAHPASGQVAAVQWSALGLPRPPAPARGPLLVVDGDPGAAASGDEVAWISTHAGPCTQLTAGDLLGHLSDRSCAAFHFAGHSVFDLDGKETGLRLADGGFLDRIAIAQADLSHVGLVFLSSCMGALTEPRDYGAGMESLAMAFLIAGVSHVIAHRWPVHGSVPIHVVRRFYPAWRDGAHPAIALAGAVTAVLGERGLRTADAASWSCWTA